MLDRFAIARGYVRFLIKRKRKKLTMTRALRYADRFSKQHLTVPNISDI